MQYRPEINGLRALAVGAVIINHFSNDLLPSGYLGVDIFFVISGFVITASLSSHPNKSWSDFLTEFYTKRIKRLVPALVLFVVITSLLVCLFNPNPDLPLTTGIASLFGLANLYLLSQATNYFATSIELNSFVHTWSLGVEEQFYLLFPFLCWFTGFSRLTPSGSKNLFWVMGALSLGSLIGFIYLYQTNQPAAYFLMPARLWELSIGCLLFLSQKRFNTIPSLLVTAAMVGVLFAPLQFAVPATIIIVLLTAILIACLRSGTPGYNLFTQTQVVYIGLISYSLYLWHWGVLSLSQWTIGVHGWSIPFQIGLMLLLAICSYRYVEKPLRYRNWSTLRWQAIGYGVGASAVAALLVFGAGVRPAQNPFFLGSIPVETMLPICPIGSNAPHWVVGDSHALEFSKVVYIATAGNCRSELNTAETGKAFLFNHEVIGTKRGGELRTRALQLLDPTPFIKKVKTDRPDIITINTYFIGFFSPESMALESYDWVVDRYLTADNRKISWIEALDSYIQTLRTLADQTVTHTKLVIVLPEPEFNWVNQGGVAEVNCQPQWFNIGRGTPALQKTCDAYRDAAFVSLKEASTRRQEVVARLMQLQSSTSNVYLYDPLPVLCNQHRCSTHTSAGVRLFRDDDHIDNEAAKLLAPDFKAFLLQRGLLVATIHNSHHPKI